ncbi:MAG: hypothetical protein Q9194_003025 [Teloschistes cf. exilis]
MTTPTHIQMKYWMYPIGNTPAVNLLRDTPASGGKEGNHPYSLLSMWRSKKHLLYSMIRPGRSLHFAARNVILFTLIVDTYRVDKNSSETFDSCRDLFHHMLIPESDLRLLREHAKKLMTASESLEEWIASPYGQYIPLPSYGTTGKIDAHVRDGISQHSKKIKDSTVMHGLRSAGPLWPEAGEIVPHLYRKYWETGVACATSADVERLASSLTINWTLLQKIRCLVSAAKDHFRTWCVAFASLVKDHRVAVHLFSGDAVTLCQTIQSVAGLDKQTDHPTAYTRQWKLQPLRFNGCLSRHDSERSLLNGFDVIDTSNLGDHIGLINMVVAAASLLQSKPTSVLYTESLLAVSDNATTSLATALCSDVATFSLLVGLAPLGFLSGTTLEGVTNSPPVVYIAMAVPRKKLKVFTESKADAIGTPGLHISVKQQLGQQTNENWYFSFHCFFGRILPNKDDSSELNVEGSDQGWQGSADLVVVCPVPAWGLLTGSRHGLAVQLVINTSPDNIARFTSHFGLQLIIFETSLENVGLYRNAPYLRIDTFDAQHSSKRLQIRKTLTKGSGESNALASGATVTAIPVNSFTVDLKVGDATSQCLTFPFPVETQNLKTRIASKSSWVEVQAVLYNAAQEDAFDNWTRVCSGTTGPTYAEYLPRSCLDIQPRIPFTKTGSEWLNMLMGGMTSSRDAEIERGNLFSNAKRDLKQSLGNMFLAFAGLHFRSEGRPVRTFQLCREESCHTIIFVSDMRHDLDLGSVVLDAWVLPLTIPRVHKLSNALAGLMEIKPLGINVSIRKSVLWNRLLPALPERCRTWIHTPHCEYRRKGIIPLSTEEAQNPLCSCGEGKVPSDFAKLVKEWKPFAKYVTRIAIAPVFPVPYVESLSISDEKASRLTQEPSCDNCGKISKELKPCGGCGKVRYCGKDCQKAGWKEHKRVCGKRKVDVYAGLDWQQEAGSYPSPLSIDRTLHNYHSTGDGAPRELNPRPPLPLEQAAEPENLAQETIIDNLAPQEAARLSRVRNIGIAAHIDSGKTTATERILYYTGRIKSIHEVRGKDAVGAKMDSMDLEREKGITIQSAATFCDWIKTENGKEAKYHINLIDTPGHIDFTIEVERALRVLDGAVMILCAVSGVQSQTITVDRQMRRYNVPRISFVNKMDRMGANPFKAIDQINHKLKIHAAAMQVPIGMEDEFKGVVDLVRMKAIYNEGVKGETVRETDEIPKDVQQVAVEKRKKLIETLADVDDEIAEVFLDEKEPSQEQIIAAVRRATISLKFTPVFMGSALADTSVQPMLDGVCDYLPNPSEVENLALDRKRDEAPVKLVSYNSLPFVGLAFKLEESNFGQLTYIRVYQGSLRKGLNVYNSRTNKKVKVPRIVRMHSNEMEEVQEIGAGEICAVFGIDCASGDTFTDGTLGYSMTSMFVPEAVISLSIKPKDNKDLQNFSKAMSRFQREDPTFRVHVDSESNETIISGMGELHLDIYVERMRREYRVACETGQPQVAYRETLTQRVPFDHTLKKQTGGAGDFARVMGWMEPTGALEANEFREEVKGGTISEKFLFACDKGFQASCEKGPLIGHRVLGARMVINDGATHMTDSSEMAFKIATQQAFRKAFSQAKPQVLEPLMKTTITSPNEFQGNIVGLLNKRNAVISDTEIGPEDFTLYADCSLNAMFGFSTLLRAATQGKGEFSMEFSHYNPAPMQLQKELVAKHEKYLAEKNKR